MKRLVPLSAFLIEYCERNVGNQYRPVAVGRQGIRMRESIYSKELAKDYSKNKIIYKNTLTVGMGSVQIDIGILTDDEIYSVSPAYHTYKINGIDACYLRFCLECRNHDMFVRFVKRGSRQGKTIDRKRWLTCEIPVYDEINQCRIVRTLNSVLKVIKARQEQLLLLDELIKSRFVEMFGSVKTNSMNWPIVEIGNIIEKLEAGWSGSGQQRDKKSGEIAVLKVSSVTQGYFIPEECKVLDNQKNIKKYIFPQKGDLLFSRANTREMVGATAIIMMDYPELILPDKLWKIQFKDNANVFYMKQVLSSTCIRKRFSAVSTGTSGSMYNVSMDKFKKIDIPLPPVNLQEKFAEFIIDIHKSRLLFKCQLLQYHNIEHIIRGRNYG